MVLLFFLIIPGGVEKFIYHIADTPGDSNPTQRKEEEGVVRTVPIHKTGLPVYRSEKLLRVYLPDMQGKQNQQPQHQRC